MTKLIKFKYIGPTSQERVPCPTLPNPATRTGTGSLISVAQSLSIRLFSLVVTDQGYVAEMNRL